MSREASIVQFIFSFGHLRPAEIFREIRKKYICLDPCILNRFSLFGPHLD